MDNISGSIQNSSHSNHIRSVIHGGALPEKVLCLSSAFEKIPALPKPRQCTAPVTKNVLIGREPSAACY
jgi:hypothetical protein